MMEKSLNYEFNTYFQNGKPSALAPVMIEYRTNSGKGTINFDMVRFFPASVHDVKTVIDILWMAPDTYEKAEIIAEYLRNVIADLQNLRRDDAYSYEEKQYNTKLTGFIKKYLANLEKIAGAFGLETVADEKAECAKMHKCEVYTIHFEDGKKVIKTFDGKYFVKNGVKYKVYKACKGRYEIIVAGTGISIGYCNKLETAPEFIDEQKERAIANIKKDNGFEKVHADFVALCDAHGITAPELSPVLLNNQEPETTHAENTPAPAPVLDEKTETSETRPAADQETRTAEPATASETIQETETSEEINAFLSAYSAKYNEFYEVQPAGALYGALIHFGIKYVSCELNIPGKTLAQTRRFIKGLLKARNDYFSSDRELAALASVINDLYKESTPETCKPSAPADRQQKPETGSRPQVADRIAAKETRTRAPYYIITRAERPQVWKPCTKTERRESGIIYRDIIGATDQQEPASADRLKSVLRLPKIQGYINLGATDKKPVTGTEQSHKATLNLTEYTHGRPPETRQKSALFALGPRCLTADRRKIKQKSPPEFFKPGVEFTQSSHLKMTKNGTRIYQGCAGYQKFYT